MVPPRLAALSVSVIVGFTGMAAAVAGVRADLPKGPASFAPLKPGVYQPSLFVPPVRLSVPDTNWRGAQWVTGGHRIVVLSWKAHNGGWEMHSTPGSTETAAALAHRLRTERAGGASVGISTRPAVAITVGGFHGWQFDGNVIGRYGHTFVPFQGVNGGKPDNGDRLAHGVAFRIIVLQVGKNVIFVEIDSDAATQDAAMVGESMKMIRSLKFTPS
jgi:hypothetical protein